ncbi:MAG: WXG100 family type VII secretion target [Solobacterium sp.]|nr:WXG100 family type VII secretion target [Solobacterium sp.]
MAQRIANNLNTFKNDINSLNTMIGNLESINTQVYNDVAALNAMWSGQAHSALVLQFVKDEQFVKDTLNWLKNFREELENAEHQYKTAENNIAELIRKLR